MRFALSGDEAVEEPETRVTSDAAADGRSRTFLSNPVLSLKLDPDQDQNQDQDLDL